MSTPGTDLAVRDQPKDLPGSNSTELVLHRALARAAEDFSSFYERQQSSSAPIRPPKMAAVAAMYGGSTFLPLDLGDQTSGDREQMSRAATAMSILTSNRQAMVYLIEAPHNPKTYQQSVKKYLRELAREHAQREDRDEFDDDEHKDTKTLIKEKAKHPGHLDTILAVVLVEHEDVEAIEVEDSPEAPKTWRERLRDGRQAVRGNSLQDDVLELAEAYGSAYDYPRQQQLAWESCHPIDIFMCLPRTRPPQPSPGLFGGTAFLASNRETAALIHPPDDNFKAEGIRAMKSDVLRLDPLVPPPTIAPEDLIRPKNNLIVAGIERHRTTQQRYVGQPIEALNQHALFTGMAGTGKSEMLANRFYCGTCAQNGTKKQSVALIDTHGATGMIGMGRVINYNPERIPDVTLLDAGDKTHTFVINPLAMPANALETEDLPMLIQGAVDATMAVIEPFAGGRSNAPRAMALARQALGAMAEANLHMNSLQLSPFDLPRFFSDIEFRTLVMELCTSAMLHDIFGHGGRWQRMDDKGRDEQSAVISRVFGELERSVAYRRMMGSGTNKFDVAELMRDEMIMVFMGSRFGRGRQLGEIVSRMIGDRLLYSAEAYGRMTDELTGQRQDGGAYILGDEAPTWMTLTVAKMLAECRKFNIALEIYAQFLKQFPAEILREIYGNTSTKGAFRQDPNETGGIENSIDTGNPQLVTKAALGRQPDYNYYANLNLGKGYGGRTDRMALVTNEPFDTSLFEATRTRDGFHQIKSQSRERVSMANAELDELWFADDRQDRLVAEVSEAIRTSPETNPFIRTRMDAQRAQRMQEEASGEVAPVLSDDEDQANSILSGDPENPWEPGGGS